MGFIYKTRIVSQDGMTTIPYDQFVLTLIQSPYDGRFRIFAVPVAINWDRMISDRSVILGAYGSGEIAKEVFDSILHRANDNLIVNVPTEDEAVKLYSKVEEGREYEGGLKPSVKYNGAIHTEAFD